MALPVGPARAAIVLYAERNEQGSVVPQLSVGLRSLDTGRVAVFQYSGEVRKLNSASRALDVALSFAEAMGFLFDDDLVRGSGPSGRIARYTSSPKSDSITRVASISPLT